MRMVQRTHFPAMLLAAALGLTALACSTPEDEYVDDWERLGTLLESVQDQASADDAKDEILALVAALERSDTIEKGLTDEQRKRVQRARNKKDTQVLRLITSGYGQQIGEAVYAELG